MLDLATLPPPRQRWRRNVESVCNTRIVDLGELVQIAFQEKKTNPGCNSVRNNKISARKFTIQIQFVDHEDLDVFATSESNAITT